VHWTVIQLQGFKALWKAQKLSDDDLQALESAIMRDPSGYPVMKGTDGLRKIRFAPQSRGKGKSGSLRIAYAQFPERRRIYLITMFSKNDEKNITAADRNAIRMTIRTLTAELRSGREP
jgi:hypothetical protein